MGTLTSKETRPQMIKVDRVLVQPGDIPLLLLHGEDDLHVPPASSRRLYNLLAPRYRADPSRLRLVAYPGAGHHPTPEMARDIEEWFVKVLG